MDNYFEYTREHKTDLAKQALNLPVCVPIFKLAYTINGQRKYINLFPTLQFLYSHHIHGEYITNKVSKHSTKHFPTHTHSGSLSRPSSSIPHPPTHPPIRSRIRYTASRRTATSPATARDS